MGKNKIRVILLEDNEGSRAVLCEVFARRGYEVFVFGTPAICPLQIRPECRCDQNERCADIIFSDLEMPVIDGLQFIENQRKKQCKTPFIAMMSGNWGEKELLRAQELRCKIFHKPFEIKEINGWLDELEEHINFDRKLTDWVKEPMEDSYLNNG